MESSQCVYYSLNLLELHVRTIKKGLITKIVLSRGGETCSLSLSSFSESVSKMVVSDLDDRVECLILQIPFHSPSFKEACTKIMKVDKRNR